MEERVKGGGRGIIKGLSHTSLDKSMATSLTLAGPYPSKVVEYWGFLMTYHLFLCSNYFQKHLGKYVRIEPRKKNLV